MVGLKSPLKKGDEVVVITGNKSFKGQKGKIIEVCTDTNRVKVEGLNMVTKHQKPGMQGDGAKIQKEAFINVSNVMLADPKTGEASRIGYKVENGKKVRVAKKSNTVID